MAKKRKKKKKQIMAKSIPVGESIGGGDPTVSGPGSGNIVAPVVCVDLEGNLVDCPSVVGSGSGSPSDSGSGSGSSSASGSSSGSGSSESGSLSLSIDGSESGSGPSESGGGSSESGGGSSGTGSSGEGSSQGSSGGGSSQGSSGGGSSTDGSSGEGSSNDGSSTGGSSQEGSSGGGSSTGGSSGDGSSQGGSSDSGYGSSDESGGSSDGSSGGCDCEEYEKRYELDRIKVLAAEEEVKEKKEAYQKDLEKLRNAKRDHRKARDDAKEKAQDVEKKVGESRLKVGALQNSQRNLSGVENTRTDMMNQLAWDINNQETVVAEFDQQRRELETKQAEVDEKKHQLAAAVVELDAAMASGDMQRIANAQEAVDGLRGEVGSRLRTVIEVAEGLESLGKETDSASKAVQDSKQRVDNIKTQHDAAKQEVQRAQNDVAQAANAVNIAVDAHNTATGVVATRLEVVSSTGEVMADAKGRLLIAEVKLEKAKFELEQSRLQLERCRNSDDCDGGDREEWPTDDCVAERNAYEAAVLKRDAAETKFFDSNDELRRAERELSDTKLELATNERDIADAVKDVEAAQKLQANNNRAIERANSNLRFALAGVLTATVSYRIACQKAVEAAIAATFAWPLLVLALLGVALAMAGIVYAGKKVKDAQDQISRLKQSNQAEQGKEDLAAQARELLQTEGKRLRDAIATLESQITQQKEIVETDWQAWIDAKIDAKLAKKELDACESK